MFLFKIKRKYLTNYLSLSFVQFVNVFSPVLILPYIISSVGIDVYGQLVIYLAILAFFQVFIEYGFSLSATKEISRHSGCKEKLSEIFSSVYIIQGCCALIAASGVLIGAFFKDESFLFVLGFISVVITSLFPNWFFQGVERMKYTSYLTVVSKCIFFVLVFLNVKEASDVYWYFISSILGGGVSLLLSLFIISKEFGVSFKFQKYWVIKKYLLEGWYVFLSRVFVKLYSSVNVIFLSFFVDEAGLGIYSLAEKYTSFLVTLFVPVNQVIYPYLAKMNLTPSKIEIKVKYISFAFVAISSTLLILSELFYYDFIIFFFELDGGVEHELDILLSILLVRVFFAPFGAFFTNVLIVLAKQKEFVKKMYIVVVVNFILVFPLVLLYKEKGMAYAVTLLSCFIFIIYLREVVISIKEIK